MNEKALPNSPNVEDSLYITRFGSPNEPTRRKVGGSRFAAPSDSMRIGTVCFYANRMRTNIFVVGDLVLDHTVFVGEAPSADTAYRVIGRQNAAGAAANTARALAVLNPDDTHLWGIVGQSHWGTFRQILEECHRLDGAIKSIEFRGIQDETGAMMNTFTRVVAVKGNPPSLDNVERRLFQFEDHGHVHVTKEKRESILYYLQRAYAKPETKPDGIIINDFSMGCLTKEVINAIAAFANEVCIPLFIDPKRDLDKFKGFKATAILPNLEEWCDLIGQPNTATSWRSKMRDESGLREMAYESFRHLGNFKHHIITCDEDGTVLFLPEIGREKTHYAAYVVAPQHTRFQRRHLQLGAGDVLTGVFALEFLRSKDRNTSDILQAFLRANAAVAAYREKGWQRMPSKREVHDVYQQLPNELPTPFATTTIGGLFLPEPGPLRLSGYKTDLERVYTSDPDYREAIRRLVEEVKSITDSLDPKNILLGGSAGSGKSRIKAALCGLQIPRLKVEELSDGFVELGEDPFSALNRKRAANGETRIVLIIDEAFKNDNRRRAERFLSPEVLNLAHLLEIRFLLIDTLVTTLEDHFHPTAFKLSEFYTRFPTKILLPNLIDRSQDVVVIAVDRFLSLCEHAGLPDVTVDGDVFVSLIDATLSETEPSPRLVADRAGRVFICAQQSPDFGSSRRITREHLVGDLKRPAVPINWGRFTLLKG